MRAAQIIVVAAVFAVGCGESEESAPPAATADDPVVAPPLARAEPAPPAPEHAVFDLVDNRLLAQRYLGSGLFIDAGSVSFNRYIRFHRLVGGVRWKLDQRVDDIVVAQPERNTELVVQLDAEQATQLHTLTLRVHSRGKRTLTVTPNEDDAHALALADGWQTLTVDLGEGALAAGTNRIALHHRRGSGLSLAWAHLGPDAIAEPPPPLHTVDADELSLPADHAVVYYAFVPEGAQLRATVSGDGCSVDATAVTADGRAAGGELGAGTRVGLEELAGAVARLELRARGCPRAGVRAAITVPGEAPVPRRAPPPRYVVLWVMDTLRADKVRTIDPDARAEIPNLSRLADSGAVFRQYYVQGNESQTSHSSVWTSLYPANHRVITAGPATNYILSNRFDAIGKVMRRAGFRTVGVTANGTVFGWSGYTKGFDTFNNVMKDGTGRKLGFRVPGDVVFDRAMEKLGEPDGPFFLFIGTIDNHKPWYGHEPWLSRYDPGPYKGRFKTRVLSATLDIPRGTHICRWTPPPREMQRIHAIYDSAISFQDAQVGRLLEKLDEWGIADETMLIITADHGEELWEHPRRCGHGSSLRESLVHVPLLVHYPPLIPRAVVDVGADGVDILPTVIDALGRDPLKQAQGQSLIPLSQGVGARYPRPSYATMNEWSHTLRMGRWKATVTKRGVIALYDRELDPAERNDVAAERPYELEFMRGAAALFVSHRKTWKKSLWGVASNMTARGAAELEGSYQPDEDDAHGS